MPCSLAKPQVLSHAEEPLMTRSIAFGTLSILLAALACNLPDLTTPPAETPIEPAIASATPTIEAPKGGAAEEPTTVPSPKPAVSPGTTDAPALRVVYTDEGDLWLRDNLGSPQQLSDLGSVAEVALSSDGEFIAYVLRDLLEGTAELRSIRADGTGDRALMTAAEFDGLYELGERAHNTLSQWAFVPETDTLLFNTRAVFEGPGIVKNDDLHAIDAGTGAKTVLLTPGAGGDFTFSADGRQVALVRPTSIGFVNVDGSDYRAQGIEYPSVITYSEYSFYPLPVWSPDGSGVLAAIPAEDPFVTPRSGTLWRVPADGISPGEGSGLSGDLFRPQGNLPIIAPTLSHLAYLRETDEAGVVELVIAETTGEGIVAYDAGSIQWMGWAPGGERFVYSKNGSSTLWLGELDQSPQPLLEGMRLRWVSEEAFLFLTGIPGDWSLMLGGIGEPAVLIAHSGGDSLAYGFARIGD